MKTMKLLFASSLVVSALVAPRVQAETAWQKNHPARTIDNVRIENQNRRINQELHRGEISHAQAVQMHRNEHAIRQEERDMARQNPGGHLTRAEQNALRQQLNTNNREIGR